MTAINRRQFISRSAAALWSAYCWPSSAIGTQNEPARLFSAASNSDQHHYLLNCRADGSLISKIAIPERAHAVSISPDHRHAVFFSRRPGQAFYVVDTQQGILRHTIVRQTNRHFYGHGAFSADGHYLYVSENDLETNQGKIGIYDAREQFKKTGEWQSHGIGPHQLALLPDGDTLVMANGGIMTRPEQGRKKLNLDTMQPALCYIDRHTGKLLGQWQPPHHQLSVRHLDVSPDGLVIIGTQFQGQDDLPLVFTHRLGDAQATTMTDPIGAWAMQQRYIASVVASPDNRYALTTTPRGGMVSLWSLEHHQALAHLPIRDVAGAAYHQHLNRFVVSNGFGQLLALEWNGHRLASTLIQSTPEWQWDNHMSLIS